MNIIVTPSTFTVLDIDMMSVDLESEQLQKSESEQIDDFDIESAGGDTDTENSRERRSICQSKKLALITSIVSLFIAIIMIAAGCILIWKASTGDTFYSAKIWGIMLIIGGAIPLMISVFVCVV